MNRSEESGHEFELRGLALARALHDPSGTQGAIMFGGSERDGVFVGHDAIHAYEFTTSGLKSKADKDAQKLADLLRALGSQPGNALKSRTGWFVTRDEPTAEQRMAASSAAQRAGERVHAISISTLHQQICNSELYVQARDNAPFGSIEFRSGAQSSTPNVPVDLHSDSGDTVAIPELADRLLAGNHFLLVGNYGVGKSHTLREVYNLLKKQHFRKKKLTPFPVYVNLRDCAGLKTPAEVLRRHAEELGFEPAGSLVSAWRAGACVLLLDGFDEVVPTRWFGAAADLRNVRRDALSAVRRMVIEAPNSSGVLVAGRSHYFSGNPEMEATLGFKSFEKFTVQDFDEHQLTDFLTQAGATWRVPDWVPTRPLLLGYLVTMGGGEAADVANAVTRAAGWRRFIAAICERESQMLTGVRPETILEIVSRVATLARSRGDVTGPIDIDSLRSAFVAVNGFQPDNEGMQLLLRLPGLAAADSSDDSDVRVFVDRDLADAAYGIDLANYVLNPYGDAHPLASVAAWAMSASALGVEVAADALAEEGHGTAAIKSALVARSRDEQFDAVTADLIRVATALDPAGTGNKPDPLFVSGVYFDTLLVDAHPVLSATAFTDCVIETLDLTELESGSAAPHFERCLIGQVSGLASLPDWLERHFVDCEIDQFETGTKTTAGIMQLGIDRRSRIALTILKKVFGQRGTARKQGALSRGLSLEDRPLVPSIIDELVSQGWLQRATSGSNLLYVGVKARRSDALRALEFPGDFRL